MLYELVQNIANRKILNCLVSDLSKYHFVHYKSHMELPGIESRPVWKEIGK